MKAFLLPTRFPIPKAPRVFEVDFLRGLAIFLMVLIHGCYSLGYWAYTTFFFPNHATPEWVLETEHFFYFVFCAITQPQGASVSGWLLSGTGYNLNTNLFCLEVFFAGAFMFLSGISCSFSKNNFKRGRDLLLLASLMTIGLEAGDAFFGLGIHIICGILHALAFAILVYAAFDHFFPKWWQHALFVIPLLALNIAVLWTAFHETGVLTSIHPAKDIKTMSDWWSAFFDLLIGKRRYGDDYFTPVLVTLVLFLGGIVGKAFYPNKKSLLPSYFPTKWATPIIVIGKYTLYIYLFHQIVILGIVAIVMLSLGAKIRI